MEFTLNVDVHCIDGRCGRSTRIILNSATEKVTHVVVKEQEYPHTERVIPVRWVKATTSELILLSHTKDEVAMLEPFNQIDFVLRDVPHYVTDPKLTCLWPYAMPARKIISEKRRQVPPGELAVRRGGRVKAIDGRVGQVEKFIVDPATGHITHLVLQEGHLWDKKHVKIPISEIIRIEENTVYLKLNKSEIKAFPVIPIRRRSC